ncbi:MAG: MFS transporter, partial [Gammaproteobacteria bacterium]|nr:MFS transporter [Gammaproteobacteria bacterium]
MRQTLSDNYPNRWRAFIGITLLSFGCYLDYTIVNVALPTIQAQLHANLSTLQWVMNIYFLALCVLATIMGRCGDLYGRRRVFYIGVFIFAIASVLAGCAANIAELIIGRLLQGVGAAIVFPLGPSLLPQFFPESDRSKAIAWFGSIGGIALALGPVLGGLIVSYFGWRWIFFINIPLVLIGFLFCFSVITESASINKQRLDWLGVFLLAFAIIGVVLSLIHGQEYGWNNSFSPLCLIIGIISGIFLVKVETKKENSLIDFKDFKNLLFFSGVPLVFLAGVLSSVGLFFDPLYLQVIRAESPKFSGLVLFAIPVAVFGVAFLVSKLIYLCGLINTVLIGLLLGAVACLMQVFFTDSTSLVFILISFFILGSMWALGNTVPIIAAQTALGNERAS